MEREKKPSIQQDSNQRSLDGARRALYRCEKTAAQRLRLGLGGI